MITCPKCGKECKENAKFCGGCGFKFQAAAPAAAAAEVCPRCGNVLRSGAKFCGKCGTAIPRTPASAEQKQSEPPTGGNDTNLLKIGSFIQWGINPGQLAVKIDESTIVEQYGKNIKGIIIQEGIKALVFIHGKMFASLDSGVYPFKGWESELPALDKPGLMQRFVGFVCNFLPAGWREKAAKMGLLNVDELPFSFVLIRASEFPLIYTFQDVHTSTVSCSVGIHLLLKITNINDFYTTLLLDRNFISFDSIAKNSDLAAGVRNQINFAFRNIKPEQLSTTPEIQSSLLAQLQNVISGIYPYFQVTRILRASADNADLENFRQMAEELYVSERELAELTKRNEFLTRLQSVKNEQEFASFNQASEFSNRMQDARNGQELNELNRSSDFHNRMEDAGMEQALRDQSRQIQYENRSGTAAQAHELETLNRNNTQELQIARSNADLETAKEKVYEQMQLSADDRAKFDLMLSAQAKLREARSEEEIAAAVQECRKSGLLREQEIEALQHQIRQQAQRRDLDDAQALTMATMQNQIALDQQKLEWEIQIGNKRILNQFDRQRIQDSYNDERRDSEINFSDRRREADAAFSDKRRNTDAAFEDSRRSADAAFEDSRRRSGIDFDRLEQENQLDMLKKAQALRMEREEAEHRREIESAEAARRHELESVEAARRHELESAEAEHKHDLEARRIAMEAEKNKLDAATEQKRIYAGMSAEQIMAANPDISEHAARALEAKFKNESALQAANEKAQMAAEMQNQMNQFMQQQMQRKDQDTQELRSMMMQMAQMNNQQNMQQMQMMRDQATAFAGAGAAAQQQLMAAKQQELDHTRADAAANSDRFVDGMKTTIEAVGNMGRPVVIASAAGGGRRGGNGAQTNSKTVGAEKNCPKCHAPLAEDAMFCENCGESL